MSLLPQLKARLMYLQIVTQERMATAEAQANVPLDQALVNLQFASYSQMGAALAEISEMPYRSLIDNPPPPQVAGIISPKWALRWSMFPVSYEPASLLLTMAVSTPDLVPRVHHLFNFFMEPYTLAFTIASEAEIRKAIERTFGMSVSPAPGGAPAAARGAGDAAARPAPARTRIPRAAGGDGKQRLPLFGRTDRPGTPSAPPAPPVPADDVGRYLTSAAALLVAAYVGENSEALNDIRSRVRYAQLMATRINLPPDRVSRLAVAAWLSSLPDKPQVIKQFLTPYNMDEVLFPKETEKEKLPLEARALSLISCYEDMRKKDPASCKEVNLTRRSLHLCWSSAEADQPMLETFLQILMDEQFLATLDRAAGRVLIVDQAEFSTSGITPLLTRDGYDVCVVPTVDAAWEAIRQQAPDLIICDVSQPHNSGLGMCQKIKANPATARIPFLFLMPRAEEKRAAECLRVGADDIVAKPVDPEVLFLKLHKLARTPAVDAAQSGVNGKLEDMSFTDMIQILSAGAKNMEVSLSSHGQEGQVFLKGGSVIHAAMGGLQGAAAFYELMTWREGTFTTKPCSTFPAATIHGSTTSLLMEGSRLSDEAGE